MSVETQVAEIIAKELDVAVEKVVTTARLVDDLGGDSLEAVEIVMALEDTFSIEIADSDAEKIITVQDAIDLVKTLTNS